MTHSYRLPVLLLFAISARLAAQQPTAPSPPPKAEVRFDFERPGLPVPRFSLNLNADGAGTYTAEDASAPPSQQIHREFLVTTATTRKLFTLARSAHLSPEACGTKAKNVANTGKKTITLTVSGATSSCTYNYADNKDVEALTDTFLGIAETMDMGRHLDFLHRFDRLGLNDAIASLDQEVTAGHALEIGTIATSLRSIAQDGEIMQRVRTRAAALLAHIPPDTSSP